MRAELDPRTASIRSIREQLAERRITCAETVSIHLDRIKETDPLVEAFTTITADEARAQADELDREIAEGRPLRPLHGVPYTLKDVFATKGIRTTAGSRLLESWVPSEDADVIRLLREAGAVLLGKVNSHEFAYGVTTQTVYAATKNPRDPTRMVGGSSGGSAAAVAAGLCVFSLGTDTAGSIRLPAAMTGTVGLKPTYGTASCRGVVGQSLSADHVGPIARSVVDAATVLDVIAGRRFRAAKDELEELPARADAPVSDLRVGIPKELFDLPMEAPVQRGYERALLIFGSLGAEVVEVSIPLLKRAREINRAVIMAETSARHAEWAETWFKATTLSYGDDVEALLAEGNRISAVEFIHAERMRDALRRQLAAALRRGLDVLLTPTVAFLPPRSDAPLIELGGRTHDILDASIHYLRPFSLTGHPAISVPVPMHDDMVIPPSIQLVGALRHDPHLLRIAHAFQCA